MKDQLYHVATSPHVFQVTIRIRCHEPIRFHYWASRNTRLFQNHLFRLLSLLHTTTLSPFFFFPRAIAQGILVVCDPLPNLTLLSSQHCSPHSPFVLLRLLDTRQPDIFVLSRSTQIHFPFTFHLLPSSHNEYPPSQTQATHTNQHSLSFTFPHQIIVPCLPTWNAGRNELLQSHLSFWLSLGPM